MPDLSYLFVEEVVGIGNSYWIVFLVVYAILTEVWRNSLVINLVSLPMYVNRANFMLEVWLQLVM
jgi:hypothetical protein